MSAQDELPPPPPRNGALAYKDDKGEWIVTCPGEALFSTATMVATHYWRQERRRWLPIFEDGE